MPERLTQAAVERALKEREPGSQVYDADSPGLCLVVGRRGASYKHVARINNGTGRYVSVTIGRADDVSLRTARERSTELRVALMRGEDPRTPKASVPTLADAMDRYPGGPA